MIISPSILRDRKGWGEGCIKAFDRRSVEKIKVPLYFFLPLGINLTYIAYLL